MARDKKMTLTANQVKIKLVGEVAPLKACLKKIDSLYPFNVKTEIKENDQDSGCHVFITVPEEGA
jgi:hypothetical protein